MGVLQRVASLGSAVLAPLARALAAAIRKCPDDGLPQLGAIAKPQGELQAFVERPRPLTIENGRLVRRRSLATLHRTIEMVAHKKADGGVEFTSRPIAVIVQRGPIRGPLPRCERVQIVTPGPNRQQRRHPDPVDVGDPAGEPLRLLTRDAFRRRLAR